jgi:hypothetical protein
MRREPAERLRRRAADRGPGARGEASVPTLLPQAAVCHELVVARRERFAPLGADRLGVRDFLAGVLQLLVEGRQLGSRSAWDLRSASSSRWIRLASTVAMAFAQLEERRAPRWVEADERLHLDRARPRPRADRSAGRELGGGGGRRPGAAAGSAIACACACAAAVV